MVPRPENFRKETMRGKHVSRGGLEKTRYIDPETKTGEAKRRNMVILL